MAPSTNHRIGAPRLDKHQRLIARLYEAMILLWIEQPIQGPHVTVSHDNVSLVASRRRLTTGLAYICDSDKGGRTTTSIAIEDSEDSHTFWVASNQGFGQEQTASGSATTSFLRESLHRLQDVTRQPNPSAAWLANQADNCARSFTAFAAIRIKKEASLLIRMAKMCIAHLNGTATRRGNVTDNETRDLERWLQQFQSRETLGAYDICMSAYNTRNDPEMDILRRLSQEVVADPSGESLAKASRGARHFVGRLAEHIRVSKQLVEDALRAREILDVFRVSEIDAPLCVQPPEVDSHTTLESILCRMISEEDDDLSNIQDAFSRLKDHLGVESQIEEQYRKIQSKPPIVHCEVQVLDHFHKKRLQFVGGDRFVGSSKFSCFCCKLYYRHHPSRPVEPDCHEQVYLNWGPIALPKGSYDPGYQEQRDVLNPLIHDVRDAFFKLMRNKRISAFNHPNSNTGLTRSADSQSYTDSGLCEDHVIDSLECGGDSDSEGGTAL